MSTGATVEVSHPKDAVDDVEKASGLRSRTRKRLAGLHGRWHHLCEKKSGWAMVGLMVFCVLAALATILAVYLTAFKNMTNYRDWAREHEYDAPVHEVIPYNFPDPAILYHKNVFYAFATNNAAGILQRPENASNLDFGMSNIQLGVSYDHFGSWSLRKPAQQPLPHVGAWAAAGTTNRTIKAPAIPRSQVWSPGIIQRHMDKRFVLYYAAASTPLGSHERPGHCIGAAVSQGKTPLGPYEPLADSLVCDLEHGGAIDPSPFKDKGGALWLAYKINGNNVGHGGSCGNTVEPVVSTPIMLQRMLKDGVTPDGRPIQILDRTDADGPLVEAPNIVRSKEGIYFLFYSSGCTRESSYDIKYATAEQVTGPYVRAPQALLRSGDWRLEAPGSPSVIKNPDDNGYVIAFASRVGTADGGLRTMWWSKMNLEGRRAWLVNDVQMTRFKMTSF